MAMTNSKLPVTVSGWCHYEGGLKNIVWGGALGKWCNTLNTIV